MALGEFELIARYFASLGAARGDVRLGVGDDGAVLVPRAGEDLVAVVDTLVEGTHFPGGVPPESIGHRAFAVNLSDLAAMGAEPAWALLALTLPSVDPAWLEAFARGAGRLAQAHGVALVGGDTTSGPLTISVQLLGFIPRGRELRRSGARPGDAIYVSGTPGDAAAGLALVQQRVECSDADAGAQLRQRFDYPTPRCALGMQLRGRASAVIDVSDGLGGDLGKLLAASGCGGILDVDSLPLSDAITRGVGRERAIEFALTGGDDYELCITGAEEKLASLAPDATQARLTRIGTVVEEPGLRLRRGATVTQFSHSGFEHFAG
jgi:thiamine-monophosphate kinase